MARTIDFEGPITTEEENTESELSYEQMRNTEKGRKARMINTGRSKLSEKKDKTNDEGEPLKKKASRVEEVDEEKRLAAEKKCKGKVPAKPALRKSARKASKYVSIREPKNKDVRLIDESDDDDDVPDLSLNAYEKYNVTFNKQVLKKIGEFSDDEDQEIYQLKSDLSPKTG